MGKLDNIEMELVNNIENIVIKLEEFENLNSRLKELEEINRKLEELDNIKSDLISVVSHEFRIPLTSIMGFTKLIKSKFDKLFLPFINTNPNLKKDIINISTNLNIIYVESDRLKNLINDMLDLNKIEFGKMVWIDSYIDIIKIVSDVIKQCKIIHMKKNISLQFKYYTDILVIKIDPDRFKQVILNILDNAYKFTPNNGNINISIWNDTFENVIIKIKDNGIGIKQDNLDKIFNKFEQVHNIFEKPKGSGLGLSICKNIISHYNGTIIVNSVINKGSEFIIVLPIV